MLATHVYNLLDHTFFMGNRIRTEIGVEAPEHCLVAESSMSFDGTISDVRRAAVPNQRGKFVEEFVVPSECAINHTNIENVFSSDEHTVYQFEREPSCQCVCRTIEQQGCPISDVHARNGRLHISFHTPDVETIQTIVSILQETFTGVHVRHLTRGDNRSETDLVLLDRGLLTQKQHIALETAHAMGYFDHPKGATAGKVAEKLGIAPSTLTEHLAAAQRKILDMYLDL